MATLEAAAIPTAEGTKGTSEEGSCRSETQTSEERALLRHWCLWVQEGPHESGTQTSEGDAAAMGTTAATMGSKFCWRATHKNRKLTALPRENNLGASPFFFQPCSLPLAPSVDRACREKPPKQKFAVSGPRSQSSTGLELKNILITGTAYMSWLGLNTWSIAGNTSV